MTKLSRQAEIGKAYEYACAAVLQQRCGKVSEAKFLVDEQLRVARAAFDKLPDEEKVKYVLAARAAVKIIGRFEPKLADNTSCMTIVLQEDSKGIEGDVRDVICKRTDGWEIGLSCKHNNGAMKHSRLSDMIDFGKEWFGRPCSQQYFDDVRAIFTPLRKRREESGYKSTLE